MEIVDGTECEGNKNSPTTKADANSSQHPGGTRIPKGVTCPFVSETTRTRSIDLSGKRRACGCATASWVVGAVLAASQGRCRCRQRLTCARVRTRRTASTRLPLHDSRTWEASDRTRTARRRNRAVPRLPSPPVRRAGNSRAIAFEGGRTRPSRTSVRARRRAVHSWCSQRGWVRVLIFGLAMGALFAVVSASSMHAGWSAKALHHAALVCWRRRSSRVPGSVPEYPPNPPSGRQSTTIARAPAGIVVFSDIGVLAIAAVLFRRAGRPVGVSGTAALGGVYLRRSSW